MGGQRLPLSSMGSVLIKKKAPRRNPRGLSFGRSQKADQRSNRLTTLYVKLASVSSIYLPKNLDTDLIPMDADTIPPREY